MTNSLEFEKFYQTILANLPTGDRSIAEIRQGFEKMLADANTAPDIHMREISIGKLSALWFEAPNARKDRAILFFPGGGYTAGSSFSHRDMLGRLTRASGVPVLSLDYRLAPEHPFPAAVEDAIAAYSFLLQEKKPEQIVVSGLSAGGGLVFALLLALKEKKIPLPKAAVSFSPWLDLTMSQPSIHGNEQVDILKPLRLYTAAKMYVQDADPKNPQISPMFGNLSGLPPIYLAIGTREILLDENLRFAELAKKSGVKVTLERAEGMFHAWMLYVSKIPEGQKTLEKAGEYIKKIFP